MDIYKDLENDFESQSEADKSVNREELLASFLGGIAPKPVENNTVDLYGDASYREIDQIDLAEYPELEITPETDEKIKSLVNIVKSLEDKPAVEVKDVESGEKYKINYRNSLNREQLAATLTTEGPLLVIAGAGSGKTRVIVHRLSYLLESGVSPQEILLLTFTRKAAKEMLSRAQELLQDKMVEKVNGGTFHSFANHALRRYANMIGISPDFTIIDSGDSQDTIDLVRTELKYGVGDKAFPKKKRIHEIISTARNCNQTIRQIVIRDFSGLYDYISDIELIARGYAQYKEISRIFDYDDLMEVLRNSLRDKPMFRQMIQKQFRYVMVDEFQDTNVVQKEIVDFIAGRHKNIMVVGDDSQSIYSFRGANYENILRFPETYPECKVVKIEQNYRSNQTLLDFTNTIVKSSVIGYKKSLFSSNENRFLPIVKKFYDQELEAEYIVSKVMEQREKGVKLKNIAVLVRAAWHWRYVEMELRKRGIPYVTVGGLAFNEKMHIKDMLAYLKLVFNPYDAVAWHRILKLIPGVGKVTAGKIIAQTRQNGGKLDINSYEKKKFFDEMKKLFDTLKKASNDKLSVAAKLTAIREYYLPILKSREDDYNVRVLDIDVFCDLGSKYDNLQKFLSEFALEPPTKKFGDQTTPMIDEGEEKPLTLSTIHSSKGLEWYSVFIPHALDGLLPSVKAIKNLEEVEEERRLFYVACSRAKEELFITMPSFVSTFNGFCSYPSRFVIEIDKSKYHYDRS